MEEHLENFVDDLLSDELIFKRLVQKLSEDESNIIMNWKDQKRILIKTHPEFNIDPEKHELHGSYTPEFAWFNLLIDEKGKFALEILKV